ncbi:MAG: glycoside hydrolase family 16 protein [Acutalibacteraceae bacterium]|nr:glycoside hydrolase family 16 protein [Acutalibacteraceae bacterium]
MDFKNLKEEAEKGGFPYEKMGRQLVWHDEFDKDFIDPEKWGFVHAMQTSDNEYDNSEKCARIEDGKLHLQLHKSDKEGMLVTLPESVATMNTMNFKYGYLEMRSKIPFRHGAWPGYWMKSNTPFAKAPYMSEVDIYEVFSSKDTVVSNLHKWTIGKHVMLPGGEGSYTRAYRFENFENLNNEFHTYGFEWDEKYMSFYVDGEKYAQYGITEEDDFSPEEMPGMACFHDFHYVLFNNEAFTYGRDFKPYGCMLEESDPLPMDYWVEYIRLYQNPEKEEIVFANEIDKAKAKK